MSFLSLSLTSFANSLDAYSEDGAVLKPDAVQSIVTFLLEAARDAQKLERMLERRLKAGELPRAATVGDTWMANVKFCDAVPR